MKLAEVSPTLRAIGRVLQDSTRTEDILFVEQTTNQQAIRRCIERLHQTPEGQRLLAERPELLPGQVDFDRLRTLPTDSLGGAYVRHLDDNGLSAELMGTPNVIPLEPDVDYVMRRFRQVHDVWHPLTALGTAPYQEVAIHSFTWAQLQLPHSMLIITLGGIKHLLLEARWHMIRSGMRQAYESGRKAAYLMPVRWEDYWEWPIDDVRRRFAIEPLAL